MNKSIWKPILLGVLMGVFIYYTGPLILVILILKFIFTPFGMGRMMMGSRYGGGGPYGNPQRKMAYADKIRNMSDEEYATYVSNSEEAFRNKCSSQNNNQ